MVQFLIASCWLTLILQWQTILENNIKNGIIHYKEWLNRDMRWVKVDRQQIFFRFHSNVEWVDIIDYDKTDIVPLVKDILNRQNQFIEIKYLKITFDYDFSCFCWVITSVIMVAEIPPEFFVRKKWNFDRIKKVTKFTENCFRHLLESRKSIDLIQEKNVFRNDPK